MQVDISQFFALQRKLFKIPFTQTEGWHRSAGGKAPTPAYLDSRENPTIAAWGRKFHLPFIGDILQIQGESTAEPKPENITAFYEEIFAEGYAMVLLSSVEASTPEREIALRKAGLVRPLGMTLCPLTIVVTVETVAERHRAWRKNLKKAQKQELKFEWIEHPTTADCVVFAEMFAEMAASKHMHYTVTREEIETLLADSAFRLFLVRDSEGKPQAGRIVYVHNDFADDVYAANANTARDNGASYFILEEIFAILAGWNVVKFDFGRIAPGLGAVNSVYEFKTFSGGLPAQYCGDWVRAKNKWVELFYLFYRVFLKKGARY